MKNKVFCSDCKHLKTSVVLLNNDCKHPDNTVPSQEPDSWFRPGNYMEEYIKHPSMINNFNQCPWFEKGN